MCHAFVDRLVLLACRLLDEKAPSAVLTSMLLCLSQLARMSQDFYQPIREANALQHVRTPALGVQSRMSCSAFSATPERSPASEYA